MLKPCLLAPQSSRCIKLLVPSVQHWILSHEGEQGWQQRLVPAERKHLPADASNSSCSILRFTSSQSRTLPERIQHAAGRPRASIEEPTLSRKTSGHEYEKVFTPLGPTKIKVRALWGVGREHSLSSVNGVHKLFVRERKQ